MSSPPLAAAAGSAELEELEPAPLLRPALAAGACVAAVAVMLGGMFLGWEPRGFGIAGGAAGVALAAWTARSGRPALAQTGSALALVALAVLALATAGGSALAHATELVRQAAGEGHVLRPPSPFEPGWRPLVVVVMGALGYCSGYVAAGLRRPLPAIGITLPFLALAAISQAPDAQVPDGIAAFALIALGVAVLYRESGDGAAQRSLAFELRRALRTAPMVVAIVAALVVMTQTGLGSLLFPPPAYDPAQAAQLPKPVPLSATTDRVLFTVKSTITGPWRTGVLDVYDGSAWRLPPFQPKRWKVLGADGVIDPLLTPGVEADVTLSSLDGTALPIPTRPTGTSAIPGEQLYWDSRAGSVRLLTGAVHSGMSYRVEAAKPPTDAELAAARPDLGDSADLEAPPPPAQLRGFLAQAPASGWARADWVRKQLLATVTASGAGLPSQVPPDRVADMLYGSRLANPFQIVAAEALLERWAGIPARIGYGFDKGDPVGGGVLAVHPRHGAFWLEVNFKGLGWFPVTGAPLHALTTLGSKDVANTNQQVQPSDKIAVQIFIPVSVTTPALLYEQLRPLVAVAAAALLALALGYALWPIPFKAYRRWRRRSWARLTGRRAQIAVAYAEFRELAVDFGDANYADTPLTFLEHVVDDEEHTEFAWMVTRFLWGDLVGRATDDDVQAAWQLSRSLRKRLARMQPWSVRALAWASRLSVRHPYEAGLDYARNRREEDRDVA